MNERMSLQLLPSGALTWVLTGAHAVSGVALWLAPLAVAWSLAGSLALAGALFLALRQHARLQAAASVVGLDLREDCSVLAHLREGTAHEHQVARSTFVSPYLTVLSLTAPCRRARFVLIMPDSVDAETFRRLRVWLLYRCNGRTSEQGADGL
jgi:toxin CptA